MTLNLLDPQMFRELSAHPERLYEWVGPSLSAYPKQPVVIDEMQKVPELLDVVHDLIEKNKALRFVLTSLI